MQPEQERSVSVSSLAKAVRLNGINAIIPLEAEDRARNRGAGHHRAAGCAPVGQEYRRRGRSAPSTLPGSGKRQEDRARRLASRPASRIDRPAEPACGRPARWDSNFDGLLRLEPPSTALPGTSSMCCLNHAESVHAVDLGEAPVALVQRRDKGSGAPCPSGLSRTRSP